MSRGKEGKFIKLNLKVHEGNKIKILKLVYKIL